MDILDRRQVAALGFALLGLAALAGAGWNSIAHLRESVSEVRQAREARALLADVYQTLLGMESSQRGYLLTSDAAFLAPLQAGRRDLPARFDALARLYEGHMQAQADMARLRELVTAKAQLIERNVAHHDRYGAAAALVLVRSGEGRVLMEQVRELIHRLDDEQTMTLDRREAVTDRVVDQNTVIGIAGLSASAVLVLVAQMLMRRELAARRRADRLEAEHLDLLEREVEQRTGDLTQAHEALAVSEARLHGIFDSATDAILTVDAGQRVVLANAAAARMLRLPQVELVGASLARFIPAQARESHAALVEAFGDSPDLARRMSQQREVTGQRADGSEFPIEAGISHLTVHGQRLYTVILHDITERKRAEAELRKSEARLRQVLTFIPEAVLLHTEGRVSFVNEAAQQLFASDETSLLGHRVLELIHPDSLELVRRRTSELLDSGRAAAEPLDVKVRRADGSVRDVQSTDARIELNGEPSVLVLMRDVTDIRRTQAELERSQARFRDVLLHLPEPVFIRSKDRIRFINRAALDVFGVDETQALDRSPLDFCHPDAVAAARARMAHFEGNRRSGMVFESVVLRPDGTTRAVEVTGAAVEFEGSPSVIMMLRDVTELRHAKRELAGSYADLQRLVSQQDHVQEEERKRIARELHDELQQRMAAILINLSAATTQLQRDPAGATRAIEAAEELAATVIDSTRRIVTGLRPQMLDELGLVPALEALCEQFTANTGIACTVRADAAAGESTDGSPLLATCLYRVAQESLNNVAKHAGATAVQVRLAEDADARSVTLQVSDNGQGLPDVEVLRKPGSFGLLGMNERLRILGGTLELQGESGEGTTVEARVPLRRTTEVVA